MILGFKPGLFVFTLAILFLGVAGVSYGEPPEFSFWANLPHATRVLKYTLNPEERHEPVPLVDSEKLAQCRVALGAPLVLIRNGALAGGGQVKEIRAGWVPRAGDDRVVLFVPTGLPDSIAVGLDLHFPGRRDREFDLYVVGDHEVRMLTPVKGSQVGEDDFQKAALMAIEDGIFYPFDFPSPKWVEGRPYVPDFPEAFEWVSGQTEPVNLEVEISGEYSVKVMNCDPFFVRVKTADHVRPFSLRGSLDYFLDVDGSCFMIMRKDRPGTGMWGYLVYRLQPNAMPELVYSDGSWST